MAGRSRDQTDPNERTNKVRRGGLPPTGSGGRRAGAGVKPNEFYRRELMVEMERVRTIRLREGEGKKATYTDQDFILIELALDTLAKAMLGQANQAQAFAARSILIQYFGLPRQQIQVSGGLKWDVSDRLDEMARLRLTRSANMDQPRGLLPPPPIDQDDREDDDPL